MKQSYCQSLTTVKHISFRNHIFPLRYPPLIFIQNRNINRVTVLFDFPFNYWSYFKQNFKITVSNYKMLYEIYHCAIVFCIFSIKILFTSNKSLPSWKYSIIFLISELTLTSSSLFSCITKGHQRVVDTWLAVPLFSFIFFANMFLIIYTIPSKPYLSRPPIISWLINPIIHHQCQSALMSNILCRLPLLPLKKSFFTWSLMPFLMVLLLS